MTHYELGMGLKSDWRHRWTRLVAQIERVETHAAQEHLLEQLASPEKAFVLAFANAHAMNSAAVSAPFFDAINSADMVLRDGSGMAALYRLLKLSPGLNLNGTDFIPRLVKRFNGRSIALFGTQEPYLQRGLERVRKVLASQSTCVSAHGFLEEQRYCELALAHRPALIVLGMGMPRQEQVAAVLRSTIAFPCLIVCGGAIIDFWGEKTPRAPTWMCRAGIEWLYRLAREPRRLFKRYVIGNPIFLLRSVCFAKLPQETQAQNSQRL